jgi:hypothetical protein
MLRQLRLRLKADKKDVVRRLKSAKYQLNSAYVCALEAMPQDQCLQADIAAYRNSVNRLIDNTVVRYSLMRR